MIESLLKRRNRHPRAFVLTILSLCAGATALPVDAGEIDLAWSAIPGVTGYRLHYALEPGHYLNSIDVGSQPRGRLQGLQDCTTYYVAVSAYNDSGESPRSAPISGWARPQVDSTDLPTLRQGRSQLLHLRGINFKPGARLIFHLRDAEGNPLIHVDSVDVVSCDLIQARVSMEPAAPGTRAAAITRYGLSVRNPDGSFGSLQRSATLNRRRLDFGRSSWTGGRRVDGADLDRYVRAHGTSEGDSDYDPDADLDEDGAVDGDDLALLASVFGTCWDGTGWSSEACP